jgi:DNA-binding beta-propeller fold protein YncE
VRVVAARSGTFYGQAMIAGNIYTVAGNGNPGFSGDGAPATQAELNSPSGIAVDATGNVMVADLGNDRVRVVAVRSSRFYGRSMKAGDIYTGAGNGHRGFSGDGGPADKARLGLPAGVAVDLRGDLLVADAGTNRVRMVADPVPARETACSPGLPAAPAELTVLACMTCCVQNAREFARQRRPVR